MKKVLLGMILGTIVTFIVQILSMENPIDKSIAVSWGDGKYGKAFYGVEVYLEKAETDCVVKARIHIGHGNDYFHDCGEIGRVKNNVEAVDRFGIITWRPEGVKIGNGSNSYFIARRGFENHR